MSSVFSKVKEKFKGSNVEETPYDKARALFNKALACGDNKKGKDLARKAYEICPEYFETLLLLISLEENSIKREQTLIKGLEKEEERLKEKGFFIDDYIGLFYSVVETRPYIKGLYTSACYAALEGKMLRAKETSEKILKLNTRDDLGARYLLMAIYSFLEDEEKLLELTKIFNEKSFKALMPLLILFYKKCDYKKANEYLIKIKDVNKDFLDFYQGKAIVDDDLPEGFYMQGDCSEIIAYYEDYKFLMDTVPQLKEFILNDEQ